MSQWALCEYLCACGRRESLELRAAIPDAKPCEVCGQDAELVIGAPMVRKLTIKVQAVTTGKSDPRPPGHIMLDTRKLGLDGQTPSDWNKELNKRDRELRLKEIKKEYG